MRTFLLQVQTSLDMYMAGPNGEMDWMTMPWSADLEAHVDGLTASVDCIVLGRRLAEGFIPAWQSRPEGEDEASIDFMNQTPKVVVSRTLTESPWDNAVVVDDLQEVGRLKEQGGGDLIAYGGAQLVAGLIAAGLLDELHLFVNPVALGAGLPVFGDAEARRQFDLVEARRFECGIATLHLRRR